MRESLGGSDTLRARKVERQVATFSSSVYVSYGYPYVCAVVSVFFETNFRRR